MSRFLKVILIVLGAFAALVAAAAVVLPLIIDPNDYKDEITAAVEGKTGREMAMPGDIELSVFPWLGVEVGEMRLANAPGFGEAPFAEIDGAGVRVKLLPLLRKRIEIGTVTLDGLHLRLARKAGGTANWDDLAAAFASAEDKPVEPVETEGGFTIPGFQVEAIKIEDAAATFDDRAAGRRYEIGEVDFSTDRLSLNEQYLSDAGDAGAIRQILRGLDLDGRLTAGRIEAANLNAENAELAVTARDGVLRFEPLGADLYGGKLRLQGTVDATGKRLVHAVKGDLNGLRFGPLLKDLAGSEKLEALGNLALDLTTAGTTTDAMIRALNGNVSFELRDGAFTGFDLPALLETARRQYLEQGKTDVEPAGRTPGETKFSRFAASFKVADGLLKGRDLSLRSNKVEAAGAGSYDLAENRLDYTVNATVPKDAGGNLAELAGVTVPIKLTGELFSPRFSIDIAGALKGTAKQRLEEEKQELRQKADEKVEEKKQELREEMQQGLRKLLERK